MKQNQSRHQQAHVKHENNAEKQKGNADTRRAEINMQAAEGREYENMLPAQSPEEAQLDPFEINFRPEFIRNRGPREAFVNEYGVVIGDHMYESPDSPLNHWAEETDPQIMSGEQWVHPFKDIGFHTEENREYFEQGIPPQGGIFMHPDKDVAYEGYTKPSRNEKSAGDQEKK